MKAIFPRWLWPVLAVPPLVLALTYGQIADQVPMHYSLAGAPDRYGHKTELWFLALLPLVMTLLLSIVIRLRATTPALSDAMRRLMSVIGVGFTGLMLAAVSFSAGWLPLSAFTFVFWPLILVFLGGVIWASVRVEAAKRA